MPKRCSLRKLFNVMDADRSGEVTMTEVTTAFKKAAGSDNKLSYEEMVKACRRSRATRSSTKKARSSTKKARKSGSKAKKARKSGSKKTKKSAKKSARRGASSAC